MRDMTVGELREALAEFPDHYSVAPFIEGGVGVLTAVRLMKVPDATEPVVLVGECDLPADLIESLRKPPAKGASDE